MDIQDILQEVPMGEEVLQTTPGMFEMEAHENPQEASVVKAVSETCSDMPEAYDNPQGPSQGEGETQEDFSEIIESLETPEEKQENEACSTEIEENGIQCWLKVMTIVVCIVDLAYIVATAVLIGMLKGWGYSVHCFLLCVLILVSFVLTIRAKTKLMIKKVCLGSCTTLVLVLMTTFTLLTRQAYYHPSPNIEPKWILFCLQGSIIPLIVGILAMYECSISAISRDRFILMITVLDFADIWDMASVLAEHRAPYIKQESSLEIAVQFFCSFSFIIFSVLISKNILGMLQQSGKSEKKLLKVSDNLYAQVALSSSQLFQNIPFMIIRVRILQSHGYIDFDYLAKNVISVILWLMDCIQGLRELKSAPECIKA